MKINSIRAQTQFYSLPKIIEKFPSLSLSLWLCHIIISRQFYFRISDLWFVFIGYPRSDVCVIRFTLSKQSFSNMYTEYFSSSYFRFGMSTVVKYSAELKPNWKQFDRCELILWSHIEVCQVLKNPNDEGNIPRLKHYWKHSNTISMQKISIAHASGKTESKDEFSFVASHQVSWITAVGKIPMFSCSVHTLLSKEPLVHFPIQNLYVLV